MSESREFLKAKLKFIEGAMEKNEEATAEARKEIALNETKREYYEAVQDYIQSALEVYRE